ncbi:hypothetical protein BW737_003540 [Actinomyces ruminis]|uniref:Uroporphyrinogen decarboxylase (URO-D) domain-containing protein n=1 Tax=Actinomyces ruminis TaxID=1937003 RepID=A0ABX4MD18_9ACTO|nr:hypothetical protein BW737_003540 [Actinomyces ruminis]
MSDRAAEPFCKGLLSNTTSCHFREDEDHFVTISVRNSGGACGPGGPGTSAQGTTAEQPSRSPERTLPGQPIGSDEPGPALLEALAGRRPERTPVWFMRQAGRSLPEYRALRARAGAPMLDVCLQPELAALATLQPVRRHGVDAAVLFSDIMVPLRLAGVEVRIEPGIGPVLDGPVRDAPRCAGWWRASTGRRSRPEGAPMAPCSTVPPVWRPLLRRSAESSPSWAPRSDRPTPRRTRSSPPGPGRAWPNRTAGPVGRPCSASAGHRSPWWPI